MKRKRFTEDQIIKTLKEVDGGAEVRDVLPAPGRDRAELLPLA